MKLQVVSDVHVEFYKGKDKPAIPVKGDILALLGDIGCAGDAGDLADYAAFVTAQAAKFKLVLVVLGNHEFYCSRSKTSMASVVANIRKALKPLANVHLMYNSTCVIKPPGEGKPICFLGTTLWTSIKPELYPMIADGMSDYSYIWATPTVKLLPNHTTALHNQSVKWLTGALAKARAKKMTTVVLTHHKPYLAPNFDPKSLDVAYQTDLTPMFGDVNFWFYGHTHKADNRTVKGTRVGSNPRGYPYQHSGWNPNLTFNV